MTRRVLLHVGAPKTGTSFVQDILFTNRDALRERGILYAADRHDAHFLAALDLMELPWGGLEHEAVGAWDRLAAEVREWPGTAIISHEILGTASRVQVARALESLGVARDRGPPRLLRPRPGPPDPRGVAGERQAPPDEDLRPLPGEPPRPRAQRRGGAVVLGRPGGARRARPLGRVAPPRARPPRHGAAARARARPCCGSGSPDCSASTRPSSPRRSKSNTSLGVPESAMIRRLNLRLNDALPNHHYRAFVREMVVHRNLSRRSGSPAPLAARRRLPLGQRPRSLVGQRARAAGVRRGRLPRRPGPGRPAAVRRPRPLRRGAGGRGGPRRAGDHDEARPPSCATSRSSCTASSRT